MPATLLVRGMSRPTAPAISNSPVRYMTQRPLGKGAGIIAAKSYFMLEKWLKPVNRNMITKAERPASLQEERRLTPSQPKPRRRMNEISRTNRDTMCLLPGRAGDLPSAYAATLVGSLACCRVTSRLPPAVTTGRGLVSCLLSSLLYLLRSSGRGRPPVPVPSVRAGATADHPHLSGTPPALEVPEC
jgi:hypothetical protein